MLEKNNKYRYLTIIGSYAFTVFLVGLLSGIGGCYLQEKHAEAKEAEAAIQKNEKNIISIQKDLDYLIKHAEKEEKFREEILQLASLAKTIAKQKGFINEEGP